MRRRRDRVVFVTVGGRASKSMKIYHRKLRARHIKPVIAAPKTAHGSGARARALGRALGVLVAPAPWLRLSFERRDDIHEALMRSLPPDLLQAARDRRVILGSCRNAHATSQRTSTPTATFAAPNTAAAGISSTPIVPAISSVAAHPTAPSGIAHQRPITRPTSNIVGITRPVSHPTEPRARHRRGPFSSRRPFQWWSSASWERTVSATPAAARASKAPTRRSRESPCR